MSRRKPAVGNHVRILPDFGPSYEGVVEDLLGTMFTVTVPHPEKQFIERTEFLYYDGFKGDKWEYVT